MDGTNFYWRQFDERRDTRADDCQSVRFMVLMAAAGLLGIVMFVLAVAAAGLMGPAYAADRPWPVEVALALI